MNLRSRCRSLVLALTTTLALAACEKTSDVPHMQEEANGMVAAYAARFDDLHDRSEELMKRGRGLQISPVDAREVSDKLMSANRKLGELRAKVQQAPSTIANAAKAGRDELGTEKDKLAEELGNGETEVNAAIQSVEAWMERAEMGPIAMAAQALQSPLGPSTAPSTSPGATPPTTPPPGAGSAEPSSTSTPPPTTPQPQPTPAAVQAQPVPAGTHQ